MTDPRPGNPSGGVSQSGPVWSPAEEEVWTVFRAFTASWTSKPDLGLFASLLHPEFLGIYNEGDPLPSDKATIVAWTECLLQAPVATVYSKLTPLHIVIAGDHAFTHSMHALHVKTADHRLSYKVWTYQNVFRRARGSWLLFRESGVRKNLGE